eukprot:s1989_g15.t1
MQSFRACSFAGIPSQHFVWWVTRFAQQSAAMGKKGKGKKGGKEALGVPLALAGEDNYMFLSMQVETLERELQVKSAQAEEAQRSELELRARPTCKLSYNLLLLGSSCMQCSHGELCESLTIDHGTSTSAAATGSAADGSICSKELHGTSGPKGPYGGQRIDGHNAHTRGLPSRNAHLPPCDWLNHWNCCESDLLCGRAN